MKNLRTFEVLFLKVPAIKTIKNELPQFAKQIIQTDCEKLEIPTPKGCTVFSVTELLKETVVLQDHTKG